MSLRILMISSVEYQSGSGLRFRSLAGALARRGHHVHYVEPHPPGDVIETPEGVTREPCPRLPGRPEWQAPLWLTHAWNAVRRVEPDVCWSMKALPNAWIPAKAAGRRGARVAVDLDDLDYAYYPPGPIRDLVQRHFDGALRAATDVTLHTDAMRNRVLQARGDDGAVAFVDQGIEVERLAAAREPAGLRTELGLGEGPVLFYAGHLGPASDLGSLLPALGPVATEFPAARLLVVGEGRDRGKLEQRARAVLPAEFVRFAGAVPHARVPEYYALADVALNYLDDTEVNRHRASIKLREALAAGVPVVTAPTPDGRRFAEFARVANGPSAREFVDEVRAELRAPDRGRAAAGTAWLQIGRAHV